LNPRPKRWQRVPLLHTIVFQRIFLVKCTQKSSYWDHSAIRKFDVIFVYEKVSKDFGSEFFDIQLKELR